ncbi:hypothetical protein [Candidatus Nitrososphaera gargensis]|uniref:hypothetical protein n=1 Tax=Candidatus Nitrososphaera gargensis TaxID=497727 RepID=UPI0011E54FB3|nr:hypothetical protein [Candidatus Nitrososphaera gargensis]
MISDREKNIVVVAASWLETSTTIISCEDADLPLGYIGTTANAIKLVRALCYYTITKMTSSHSSSPSDLLYSTAKRICSQVLQLDNSIRFAGLANHMGSLISYELRKGLVPLLNEEELKSYTLKTVLRMKTREDYESKLGDVIYTFALYKKIKRATIPLDHPNLAALTVSFDMAADHEGIIIDKILPMIRREKLLTTAVEA